jgi:hypothetical protein
VIGRRAVVIARVAACPIGWTSDDLRGGRAPDATTATSEAASSKKPGGRAALAWTASAEDGRGIGSACVTGIEKAASGTTADDGPDVATMARMTFFERGEIPPS